MTGFTLGNISVVGTYYTHALNLTPRGLLAVTVADTVADGLLSAPYRTVRHSRRVGYSCGGLSLSNILAALFNILAAAGQLYSLLTYPRGQLSDLQLPASRQLAQLQAIAALFILRIFSANRYETVTINRTI